MDESLTTIIQRSCGQAQLKIPHVTISYCEFAIAQKLFEGRLGFTAERLFSGDYIEKVTPVPIPNTEVKLFEPMIVPKARK